MLSQISPVSFPGDGWYLLQQPRPKHPARLVYRGPQPAKCRRVEGTQVPPLIEPDGRISRIRLSEVVHRNGYRFHATVVGIFQS